MKTVLAHFDGASIDVSTQRKVLETIQHFYDQTGFWPTTCDHIEVKVANSLDIPGLEIDLGTAYIYVEERVMRLEGDTLHIEYNTRISGTGDDYIDQ